jgi:hypothetical protein
MPQRVLVLGGQGVIGSFIARAFGDAGWEATRAGRRPEDADDFRLVDLDRPETVDPAVADASLVVSTVHHPGLHAERAVLRDGGTLIHLDDLREGDRERLRREVPEPRGLVLDRSGLGGVTGLAIKEMLSEHPEADTVEFGFLLSAAERTGPAGALLARRLMAGDGGRLPDATIDLPAPFGRRRCIEAVPSVAREMVGPLAGGRAVRLYGCFVPRPVGGVVRAMNAVGLLSRLPESAYTLGRGKVPKDLSSQPTAHWGRVLRGEEVLAERFVLGNGDYRSTVGATRVYAEALQRKSRHTGVLGVDELFELREFERALSEHCIRVERRPHVGAANSKAEASERA